MCTSRRLATLILALLTCCAALADVTPDKNFGRPHINAVTGKVKAVDAKVVNFDKVIYQGSIDVNPTVERIRKGERLEHRNDGAYFQNREKLLPTNKDRQYYREFVVWQTSLNAKFKSKIKFPGPLRIVISKKGDVYFTGDHYSTWKKVR